MNTRPLLVVSAVLEFATGAALLLKPSLVAQLLLGAELISPESVCVGRIAGAALLSIGVSCWLGRNHGGHGRDISRLAGLTTYNVSVSGLLAHAAIVQNIRGPLLWPAIALHSALAVWCVACLRSNSRLATDRPSASA